MLYITNLKGLETLMINDLIYYYEQILMGNENTWPAPLFDCQKRIQEQRALKVFKYVIEDYMKWSPEDAAVYLDYNFIVKMKLDKLLPKITFPKELDPKVDMVYIVSLLYPDKVVIDAKQKILLVYKKVLRGDSLRLPKSFTIEPEGIFNACICLQYVLEQNYMFNSIEEMYQMFTTTEASRLLKKYRLQNVQKELFLSPLDYLHESLPEDQKDEILYHKYALQMYEKSEKRKK